MIPAITGVGAVTAVGCGSAALAEALRVGRSGIGPHPDAGSLPTVMAPLARVDLDVVSGPLGFDERMVERLARAMRRAGAGLRAAVVAAAEAWAMAGLGDADPERVGLVVSGSNLSGEASLVEALRFDHGRRVSPSHAVRYCDFDHVGVISDALGIRGEGYTVGAASASGGVAVGIGARSLVAGDLDAVVVVGAPTMLSAVELAAFSALGALYSGEAGEPSWASCRPFDSAADGFVYGQGAAALVLERSGSDRTLAWLAAAESCLDANRLPDPSVSGEVRSMLGALRRARLRPGDVSLVNAHGTSSPLGDAVEAEAIEEVFGSGPTVNASKPIVGHCIGAAGVVEAVATVLQLEGGFVHGNITLEDPIRDLRFAGHETVELGPEVAVSNSFGFGGVNSTLVLLASR